MNTRTTTSTKITHKPRLTRRGFLYGIGGTALAGGIGTIYGAILGALIMQSLQSGMGMVGVDTPFQNIVVGAVLVVAVWIDIVYRKRTGAMK